MADVIEPRMPTWPEVERFLIRWETAFKASREETYVEAVQEVREVFAGCFGGTMPDRSEDEHEDSPEIQRAEFLAGERASPHGTDVRSLMLARAARGSRRNV